MKTLTIGDMTLGSGLPKICVPLTGESPEKVLEEARQTKALPCQLIEWRADYMLDAGGAKAFQKKGALQEKAEELKQVLSCLRAELDMPIIFTLRRVGEGGKADLSRKDYEWLNCKIAQSKMADFIDIEVFESPGVVNEKKIRDMIKIVHKNGARVLLSNHEWEGTPELEELLTRFFMMQDLKPDLMKLAVMPKTEADVCNLLEASALMRDDYAEIPFIAISMGELGVGTRICAGEFGSAITFAAGNRASAPGQLSAESLYKYLTQYYEKQKAERG